MLNQLQSQVAFDHTEAGFFGTDLSGAERAQLRQQIAEKDAQIAEKDRHIKQLIQERVWLQTNVQRHLTYLQSNSTQAIHGLRGAFSVFEERIRSDGVALQQMMQQDALARQTATHQ